MCCMLVVCMFGLVYKSLWIIILKENRQFFIHDHINHWDISFPIHSCRAWMLRLVVILLIIFNFFLQGEKPPGLYDPNRPAYSKDVCFLYSDSDAHESKSMSHSKNPDNKTINSIRGFLEDKNIRCSIARPPIDSHGEFRFEISIMLML